MIVDSQAYWISFLQVFFAAAALLVFFPMVLWRKYLRGKPYAFRFVFCVLTQNAFLVNLVLLLGYFNACNRWTVGFSLAAYYMLISWTFSDRRNLERWRRRHKTFTQVLRGTKKLSSLSRLVWLEFKKHAAGLWYRPLWQHIRAHCLEYLLLAAASCYTAWFMAHNTLTYHSVQFSDIPVHQSWIYALSHGTLFSDGIYPFGMHAVAYLIHSLFGLDLREVLLYFGVFQTVLLLLITYIFARELFRFKGSALLALICFALLVNQGRFAASLPQECGMFAVSGAAYCLLRFLRTPLAERTVPGDGRLRRFFRINQYLAHRFWTTDALLFMLSVSLCIAYHFYTAIAACMLVFTMLLSHGARMVRKRYWVPVIVSGTLGVMIAVLPFAACYARGIPFQESMQWALTVMSGEEWHGSDANYQDQLEKALEGSLVGGKAEETPEPDATDAAVEEPTPMTLREKVLFVYRSVYNFALLSLFGGDLTQILMFAIAIGLLCTLAFLPFERTRLYALGYASMLLYTILMMIMGAAQSLGIPEVIAAARASTFLEPYLGIVYLIPLDSALGFVEGYGSLTWRRARTVISAVLCAALTLLIFRQNWVHSYFDVNLAYYNEPDYLTKKIRQQYPKGSFTIVSTTDEYYQVVDYGYHENLSKFMNMVNGNEAYYTIPTEYVFFFIEKKVLDDFYFGSVEVSPEYAQKDFVYMASTQDYYFQRAVLESQAYYWARSFAKIYPDSFKIIFEDSIYICYMAKQNPYSLYDFRIDYLGEAQAEGAQ